MSVWSDAVSALSPYGWWRLGEASGTTANDSSGNGRHGGYSASIGYGQTSLVPSDTGDTAILIDGVNDSVSISSLSFSSTGFTAAVTVDSSTPPTGGLFASGTTNYLNVGATNVSAVVNSTSVTLTPSYPSANLFDGAAHLVVLVVKATSVELWVDGVMVASGSHALSSVTRTSFNLKRASAGPLGTYDELILWDSTLSSTQIEGLYDAWEGSTSAGTISLAGTLRAKTASFTVATVVGATLAGTLQGKTAAFTVDVPAAPDRTVSLSGELQRKTAVGEILVGADVALVGELRRKTSSFTVLTPAVVSLAGTLQPKTAALAVESSKTVTLGASLRRKTGSFSLTAPWTLTFAATLRRKTATVSLGSIPNTARNRIGGRVRRGVGVVDYSPPIVAAPAGAALGVEKETAQAFGAVTIDGTQPRFTVTEASVDRDTDRILVGGKDITWWRGIHTPTPDFSLIQPLLYGSGQLRLPQLAVPFEQPGVGALRWLRKEAPVVVQRVRGGVVVATDYKGFIVDHNISGGEFTAQLGGEASGRAALMNKQMPVYRQRMDFKKWAYFAIGPSGLGLPFRPYLGGSESGIKLTSRGGMSMLDYINEMCALAVHRNGDQWTIKPGTAGKYHAELKDRTTVDATVYFDDARLKPDLRSDIAEEPNRIFVTGITPGGQKVKFGHYPRLLQGRPPPFPGFMTEGSTGDGVTALIWRLRIVGKLYGEDAPGGYDEDVTDAVKMVQSEAGLTQTGNVNLDTWRALYDLEVTGYSMTGSGIHPAAQDSRVREFHRSPTGSITHRNPNHRAQAVKVDKNVNMGTGFTRPQQRQWAQNEKQAADAPNWVGTLTLSSGQGDSDGGGMTLIRGTHAPGGSLSSAQVMQRRELRPGMNVWAPQFMGGTLFHVSGVEVGNDGRDVRISLDTRARDTMKVWETIARNRESRHNPARAWMNQYRSSTIPKDGIVTWDEVGGLITGDVTLAPGWNVFPVVAGEEGTVAKIRVRLADEIEFASAVFGRHISADRLAKLVPAPLTKTRNDREGTGEPWYEKPGVKNKLEERFMLAAFGTHDEPCGYGSKRKWDANGNRTDATPTGSFTDDASFSYRTFAEPVLYVAVWVPTASAVEAGRIMWQQREEGS